MNESRKNLIHRLMAIISKGDVISGGKLPPERELAALLGTSRPALREAEIALEALGVLEIRDRQGVFIAGGEGDESPLSLGEARIWPTEVLSQVMEIRLLLDPAVSAIAALRRTDRDMARLEHCLRELEALETVGGADNASLGAYWNVVLHSTVVQAAGNALLSRMYETLLNMTQTGISAMRMDVLDSSALLKTTRTLEEHQAIVSAIRERDPRRAGEASRVHLRRTVEVLIDLGRISPLSDILIERMEGSLREGKHSLF